MHKFNKLHNPLCQFIVPSGICICFLPFRRSNHLGDISVTNIFNSRLVQRLNCPIKTSGLFYLHKHGLICVVFELVASFDSYVANLDKKTQNEHFQTKLILTGYSRE